MITIGIPSVLSRLSSMLCLSAMLATALQTPLLGQTILVSNLGESAQAVTWQGSNSDGDEVRTAASFTTGNSPTSLGGATIWQYGTFGNPSATFTLSLASSNSTLESSVGAGFPSSIVATFSGSTQPSAEGQYNYTLSSPYALAANTTYWLVVSAPSQSVGERFVGYATSSAAETSAYGFNIGDFGRFMVGSSSYTDSYKVSFSLQASAIPEPSAYAAFLGLAALSGVVLWRRRGQIAA
jgi:hypothetical protein